MSIPHQNIFPIENPSEILRATLRLKNYSVENVSQLDTFDVLFSQSYEPDKLPVDEEEELFKHLANLINDMTTDVTNDKFSHSIYDTEFPLKMAERLSTRDILKQKMRIAVLQLIKSVSQQHRNLDVC